MLLAAWSKKHHRKRGEFIESGRIVRHTASVRLGTSVALNNPAVLKKVVCQQSACGFKFQSRPADHPLGRDQFYFEGFPAGRGITGIGNAIKRCQNQMKILPMKINLLLLGAVALTAVSLNAADYNVTRSPRAVENQIHHDSGTATDAVPEKNDNAVLQSPRAADNQIKVASGAANDFNRALACRKNMTGSPKAVGACADNPAMPVCGPVTVAQLQ
jgi:hypothetical protein